MSASLSRIEELALGMLSREPELLEIAQRVTDATAAPVVGGLAVFLHGYLRTTEDIDLFADDERRVASALEAMGASWDAARREHTLDGAPIHMVTARQTGDAPERTETIKGVRVVGLADLVRFKLRTGLGRVDRARDLADVVELIRRSPLDKAFAARLPKELRTDFKKLVDAVRSAPDDHPS